MKRVVITGMGAITPLGNNIESYWNGLVKGQSGIGPLTKFDTSTFKTQIAAEVKGFEPASSLDKRMARTTDLFTQYALVSAKQALEDSGLELNDLSPYDIGVIWGTGQGGMNTFEEQVKEYSEGDGTPRFSPYFVPKIISNMASGMIAIRFGIMGINYTTVSACATGNSAIMDAMNYIRLGKAKVFITGGSEAPITEASIGGFNSMKAMSTRNEEPEKASRPFDASRDGFVIGEGAGALILEEYEFAKRRGAKIYAEVVGAAMTADAYHMSATHPEGLGAAKAIELALNEAGLNHSDIDYLNAHATSTPVGDLSEVMAIRKVFGDKPGKLTVSATKSMTGHLLGAAGAIEAITCVLAINHGVIPPTVNLEERDKQIPDGISIVGNEARETNVNVAMNNTFGFGGHNAIAIFRGV